MAAAPRAQRCLAAIAGTRDDLPGNPGGFDTASFQPPHTTGLDPWPEATAHFPAPTGDTFAHHVHAVARRVARVTGHEPAALDLSAPGSPVHAVQVVCPGTRSRIGRSMPR
ncbi:hypothetical protein [Streptomyces sp. NPDC002602]|uniref:hypothetical protein n=1 Tax=Streptomyces sp. NPDC002602 TaxID=3364654 RepID=UPI0036823C10